MTSKPMPAVIAHRGASGHAPENTLAAISLAADKGAEWIEIDVNVSRDGIPVLHHDDGLERCTNGSGLVIEHNLHTLKSLDSGIWFGGDFTGERIATLQECLALAKQRSLGINLEIKPSSGWEVPTTERIAEVLRAENELPRLLISSFSHLALLHAKQLLPHIPRGSLFLVPPPDWRTLTAEVEATTIHLHANSLLSKEMVSDFHTRELGVYCYTVNSSNLAEQVFNLNADGIFTNYPAELLAYYPA